MGAPERFYRNGRIGPDGRFQADLNGCTKHPNVCDMIRWGDGREECMICARDRQPQKTAFHLPPYWDWIAPAQRGEGKK